MAKGISLRKQIGLSLFRSIHKRKVEEHSLRQLFWECTLRCNLNCRHCGSDCKKEANKADMPIADFLKVIDNITPHVNPNNVFVIFIGGEALVRNDIEECGLELYRRGFPWGMVTNGLLLNRKRLDSLLQSGMHSITISLDGFEDEHNWIRRNTSSFEKASNAIKMLAAEPEIVWDVVTCVTPKMYPQLDSFSDYLISIGVKKWRLFTIFPVGRAASDAELQLDNQQFIGLLDFIKRKRKEGKITAEYGCEGFLGNYETEVRQSFFQCNAGVSVASVLADGSISACPSIRSNYHQGSIYTHSFIDVWNNKFELFRNRSWAKKDECADCAVFKYCEGGGMHLRDDDGKLLFCHYKRIKEA